MTFRYLPPERPVKLIKSLPNGSSVFSKPPPLKFKLELSNKTNSSKGPKP